MSDDECTCGQVVGFCDVGHNFRVTWRDVNGNFHVNGTGVVIDDMTPDLTGAPEWTTRVRGEAGK